MGDFYFTCWSHFLPFDLRNFVKVNEFHVSQAKRTPYCYCNEGYYGSSCSETSVATVQTYDGYSVQLGLLITLLLVALALVGAVGYLVYRLTQFKKQTNEYGAVNSGAEMVETVHF